MWCFYFSDLVSNRKYVDILCTLWWTPKYNINSQYVTGCPISQSWLYFLPFSRTNFIQNAKVGGALINSENLLHDRQKNFENLSEKMVKIKVNSQYWLLRHPVWSDENNVQFIVYYSINSRKWKNHIKIETLIIWKTALVCTKKQA